jgi:anion-transporting  ArsA/GET3 family ATPase
MFQRKRHLPDKPQKENEMAKKQAVNKTQRIKEKLAKFPNSSPIKIAEALKEYGVTAQYVSTVKFNMNKKSAKKAGKKTSKKVAKKSEPKFTLSELVKASRLAEELGGAEKAKELLNALEKLS